MLLTLALLVVLTITCANAYRLTNKNLSLHNVSAHIAIGVAGVITTSLALLTTLRVTTHSYASAHPGFERAAYLYVGAAMVLASAVIDWEDGDFDHPGPRYFRSMKTYLLLAAVGCLLKFLGS